MSVRAGHVRVMSVFLHPWAGGARLLLGGVLVAAATMSSVAGPEETPFLAENDRAMATMMRSMKISPSGDVDRDFVAMMVPHHQGAIDMAQAELRYGHNEQLRRLAQEIIVTQQQEIVVMQTVVGESPPATGTAPLPPSQAAPAGSGRASHSSSDSHE
jgi:hypothetical protein